MEPPFNGVSTKDPVREAVELLTGESQALIVSEHGRPMGIVTRTDLLESLVIVMRRSRRKRRPRRPRARPRPTATSSPRSTSRRPTSSRRPASSSTDYDYSRSANPTRSALERALGELEGGLGSAFSSGMAAEHALITAVCSAGDHVVIPDDLYGGTYRLVDKVLARWGLVYTMVDQTDLDAVEAAVRDDTKLVWVETPTNPTLKVIDVPAIVERARGAFVAVDNTFATPVYQRPLELGADAAVHSTTKYLGGHSDAVGGAVVVREEAAHQAVRFVQNSIGAVPGPLDCLPHAPRPADAARCAWPRIPRTRASSWLVARG